MAALETGQLPHVLGGLSRRCPGVEKHAQLQLLRRTKGVSYIYLEFTRESRPSTSWAR